METAVERMPANNINFTQKEMDLIGEVLDRMFEYECEAYHRYIFMDFEAWQRALNKLHNEEVAQ